MTELARSCPARGKGIGSGATSAAGDPGELSFPGHRAGCGGPTQGAPGGPAWEAGTHSSRHWPGPCKEHPEGPTHAIALAQLGRLIRFGEEPK